MRGSTSAGWPVSTETGGLAVKISRLGRGWRTVLFGGGLSVLVCWLAKARPEGWMILGAAYFLFFGAVVVAALVVSRRQRESARGDEEAEEQDRLRGPARGRD